jgi:hypothetical protein
MIENIKHTITIMSIAQEIDTRSRLRELEQAKSYINSDYYWNRKKELNIKLDASIRSKEYADAIE